MDFSDLDWPALDRLRTRFLADAASPEPYWESESALASYDLTFGERIGWKWDQVLRELEIRGWLPGTGQPVKVLDWGCGSGIASRRVIARFGMETFGELILWDHSPLAVEFAAARAGAEFPGLRILRATPSFLESDERIDLLIVSHVLNEMTEPAVDGLLRLIDRSGAVVWVEPGTSAVSRRLAAIRDGLIPRFRVVAPCTHQLKCPLFATGNERHWCHFFAPPPAGIFANGDWVKFGQRAGIDLRSVPYSFMALDRESHKHRPDPMDMGSGRCLVGSRSRIIGRPEFFKPYARFLNCDETGLKEKEVLKRDSRSFVKELDRTREPLVLRWDGEQGPKLM